jgi:ketosteroid isomerase-like protein
MAKPGNIFGAAICCLLFVSGSFGQHSGDDVRGQESKLMVLERLWNDAQVHRDAGALASLIADKFTAIEYDGEISDRGKFLSDIADPKFKPASLNIQDMKVNLYRDTAVITGIYRAKGAYQGKPYDHLGRFTDTWIFEDGKWQCVASHSSLLKK